MKNKSIDRVEKDIERMNENGYCVADSVTCGKKGKKPIKTVVVKGFPHIDYEKRNGF